MNRHTVGSLMAAAVLLLAGCHNKSTNSGLVEETATLGPQFSAKKGLLVPEDTRRALGLKMVEVAEQKVSATVALQLRVYEVRNNRSLASGMVLPEEAKLLKTGSPLVIRISESQIITGKISALVEQSKAVTGTVELLAEIPDSVLAVGSFVEGSIPLTSGESVVSIPRQALLQSTDGYSVYTSSGEHLVRTPVKVGVMNQEFVEIKDGLYAGDQVVLQPVMSLWMTELAAVIGGQACCVAPPKGK